VYRLRYVKSVEKDLRKLHKVQSFSNIIEKIQQLAENPTPPSSIKLKGVANLYRVRIGQYRIVYTIKEAELVVLVVGVGHRKDIYDKL